MSVISLHPLAGASPAAAHTIQRVADDLRVEPRTGADGSWEFHLDEPYSRAHARVVAALEQADAAWSAALLLDYALAV